MKELTVNQIMLLLDIFRGTDTQDTIGTHIGDLKKLYSMGLIKVSKGHSLYDCTDYGNTTIEYIKTGLKDYFLDANTGYKPAKQ